MGTLKEGVEVVRLVKASPLKPGKAYNPIMDCMASNYGIINNNY